MGHAGLITSLAHPRTVESANEVIGKARATFAALPRALQAPSYHPDYVCADALRDKNLNPSFFLFEESGELFYHAFHVARVPGRDCFDIQSPYGYGGPVANSPKKVFLSRAWEAYFDWCHDRRILAEFIRFHPLLQNWDFYWGEVFDDRQTVWLDLTADNLLNSYHQLRRRNIQNAKRNELRVSWVTKDLFLQDFRPLYDAMLQKKAAGSFYYFNSNYYRALLDCEFAHGAVCLKNDKPIAAALFVAYGEIMEYHLGTSSDEGQRLGAMTLLLHEAALLAQSQGRKYYHLGGGTDRTPENSLLFFKSSFSDLRGQFKIGRYVHEAQPYAELKQEWERQHGKAAQQVLFYRF
jgi:Acetyltransferase (GNAT) domain